MKIVAQIEGTEFYLVQMRGKKGFVVNRKDRIRYSEHLLESILLRGGWEKPRTVPKELLGEIKEFSTLAELARK